MRIYFLGICGTAMGNAALLLRSLGHTVTGVDENVYPPMSDVLAKAGVRIRSGYDSRLLEAEAPDLVVVGNALSRGNPEVEWLLSKRRVPMTSLPELLSRFVLSGRRTVVVSGTHGKTTTSAMTAYLLRESGRSPGYFIGGVPRDLPAGAELGEASDPFVIEGDEYDSAFFDKRGKFIHYRPEILVVNNIEFDHADIFRDLEDIQRSFSHLYKLVPAEGWILVNGDDPNCPRPESVPWTRLLRVGMGEVNDLRIRDFREDGDGTAFRLVWRGRDWAEVAWLQPGEFNARNAAMAALASALAVHPEDPLRFPLQALARFCGVRRRLEPLHGSSDIRVFEDFGHHPTAIGQTIMALQRRFSGAEICAVVEPRSNTMRGRRLQDALIAALRHADSVIMGVVNRGDRLPENQRLDTFHVAECLRKTGTDAVAVRENAAILEELARRDQAGRDAPRVVVFFTNGSFDGVPRDYAESLKVLVNHP
jgi:UDP-N-acetylmuramate: L-alanyl-gamma-D-glutamyl-meso-diaminopimelate ligase